MKTYQVKANENFIGRQFEIERIQKILSYDEATILIVYGRRRVGKTELLEQVFQNRNIIKIEGLEKGNQEIQIQVVLSQLAEYIEDPLLKYVKVSTWTEVFKLINEYIQEGEWTLYFEEVQWLANYSEQFIAELKYAWDNYFRKNNKLILILCGSSPSYIIENVILSKSLYNRAQFELPLKEFNLNETKDYLKGHSNKEIMDAFLTVGGIPEYLKWVSRDSSVFLSLCQHSFVAGSFFSMEYKKIFTSSLAKNKHYKAIIEYLGNKKYATRSEIIKHLKITSGSGITNILTDLEQCGFIDKYTPFNQSTDSKLVRYSINDNYLHFYFKYIKPIAKKISNGAYNRNPSSAINMDSYYKWLGFAFERMCRKYYYVLAKILGFESVKYNAGPYFSRSTAKSEPGFQIDLMFERNDQVYTICEIKYSRNKINTSVIDEFERKLERFPNKKNYTIDKVLITFMGVEDAVIKEAYFDRIIDYNDFFNLLNW